MGQDPQIPKQWLTTAQERTLANTVQYLEDRILGLLTAMEGGPYARSLTKIEDDITPEQKEACKEHLEAILGNVQELARRLDVEPDVVSLSRRLMGGVSSMWTYMEDTRAQQLKKYGRVHRRLPEVLDPPVESMIQHLEALRAVLEEPGEDVD